MKNRRNVLRDRLGNLAIGALLLIAVGSVFHHMVVKPLERENFRLEHYLEARRGTDLGDAYPGRGRQRQSKGMQMAAFYRFFQRPEDTAEWLARLYGAINAAGLEMRVADYRLIPTTGRIQRYQIALPLTGTQEQLQTFLQTALNDIPILSLDAIVLHRKAIEDQGVEAEIKLTLHLAAP